MKKHFIIYFFVLTIISVYSAETWLSAEYQYGFSFVKGEDLSYDSNPSNRKVRIGSHGVNIKTYIFWKNKNIGLFTKTALAFPYFYNTYSQNDYIKNIDIPLSVSAGVGFRHFLSEKSNIHYAFGVNFDFNFLFANVNRLIAPKSNTKIYAHELIFKLISDIGYKYSISNNIYLNAGSNVNFGFAKHLKNKSPTESFYPEYTIEYKITSKWAKGFFAFEFLPYFGIGFIINSK